MGEYCESFMPMEPEIHQKEALRETWSEKSHQMSKKVSPKWFDKKNDRFWHLFKNYLRLWDIWAN